MSVDVRSDTIERLVDENVEVEQLGTGFTFTEGPIWNPGGECLLFSDVRPIRRAPAFANRRRAASSVSRGGPDRGFVRC